MMIKYRLSAALVAGTTVLYGCGGTDSVSDSGSTGSGTDLKKAAWDRANAPSIMDTLSEQGYSYHFETLPLSGKLSTQPWSGGYWPTYLGGISYRWNMPVNRLVDRYGYDLVSKTDVMKMDVSVLSPSEKFDIMLGRYDFPYTRKERQRTNILRTVPGSSYYRPGYSIPGWEGLCHAWAPATLAYQEPKPVTGTNRDGIVVPFGSSDLKGLLTYFLHEYDAPVQFLAKRCNVDLDELSRRYRRGEISGTYYNSQRKACADTNAGAFHVVLTNQIGLIGQGFVADVDRDAEVWNQPVHSYTSEIVESREGASLVAAPGTVREVRIHTRMHYTQEIQYSWEQPTWQPDYYKDYDYWLELDVLGNIIGGEWYSADSDRPDFLWKQGIPEFSGDYKVLQQLYKDSVQES